MEIKEDNSGHVSKVVHQFYFVKLWPTNPDSIGKIKKEENIIMKMNQDTCKLSDIIAKKTLKRGSVGSNSYFRYYPSMKGNIESDLNMALDELNLRNVKVENGGWFGEKLDRKDTCKFSDIIAKKTLKRASVDCKSYFRYYLSMKGNIESDLNMALDELNLRNVKVENGGWFGEKLDRKSLHYKKLHGSKSLGEEKHILRDIRNQQKDVDPFEALEVLKETVLFLSSQNYYYRNINWLKLAIDIEQFQNQHMERASMYDNLKKSIKHKIELICDYKPLKNKRRMECETNIITSVKEFGASNKDLYSLNARLTRKYKKKDEAKQRILTLKKLYHEEILDYYQYCSLINKVYQLAEEKDVAALEEMSSSEVGKFMLEWNNNKAFREDYETKILGSLDERQLSRDGRRRPDKSCCSLEKNL
ncbi:proton pump-interactor [Trifolium repens]|nr:proton pump-interactor [Trifolium repens]